jgi:hypothetical protein
MGKTLQDVISDWIGKLNNREIGVLVDFLPQLNG